MNNTSQHNGFSVHNGTAGESMPPKVKPVSSAYSEAGASTSAKRGHRRKDGEAEQGQTDAKQTPTHRRAPKGTARPAANRTAADRPSVRRSGIAAEVAATSRSGATGHRAARTTSASAAGAASSPSAGPTARKSSGFASKVKEAVSAGAERVKGAAASTSAGAAPARRPARGASSGERSGASAVDEERASRRAAYEARRQSSLMKYANDNRVVRALYDFTSGPYRAVFYVLVVAVIALGVYFPVRDLYIAHRTNGILQEQLAIREKYNESLEKEVNKYLSQEGIEEAAREQGMVMPGETPITVQGANQLGDNGKASSRDGIRRRRAIQRCCRFRRCCPALGEPLIPRTKGRAGTRRIPRPANRPHLRRLSGRSAKSTQIPPGTTRCWTPYSSILAQRTRL